MSALQAIFAALPGREAYHLDVPGTPSAAALSVVSFVATEKIGEPNAVRIVLTHPLALAPADYLNRDAMLSTAPDDGFLKYKHGQCLPRGKPVKNKDGSPKMKTARISTGEWAPKSASSKSSARGTSSLAR